MSQSTMTSKGQITVPKQIRDYLKAQSGDKIQFIIDRQGRVVLTIKTIDIGDVFGMFNYKSKEKTTIKDMDSAIAKRMRRKYK